MFLEIRKGGHTFTGKWSDEGWYVHCEALDGGYFPTLAKAKQFARLLGVTSFERQERRSGPRRAVQVVYVGEN